MKIKNKSFNPIWFLALTVLLVLAFFWYIHEVRPWLMSFTIYGYGSAESINIVAADTYTYWYHASETPWALVPVNLLGPVSLIKLLGGNFDLAVLFYVICFVLGLRGLYRYAGVRVLPFTVFFLANPSMMGQLFAVNKEIVIMISLLFVVVYVHSRRTRHIIAAIAMAAFSKPQFLAFIIFFLGSSRLPRKLRPFILLSMIIMISLFYADLPNMDSYTNILMVGQTSESLGITVFLHELALQYYLYFSVIVPRLLLTIYSGGFLYASFLILAFIPVIFKKKLKLADDVVFLLYLFLIMMTVIPFPHYRYILPIYPLLLILALRPKNFYITSRMGSRYRYCKPHGSSISLLPSHVTVSDVASKR